LAYAPGYNFVRTWFPRDLSSAELPRDRRDIALKIPLGRRQESSARRAKAIARNLTCVTLTSMDPFGDRQEAKLAQSKALRLLGGVHDQHVDLGPT
jgi:hypothetical protein